MLVISTLRTEVGGSLLVQCQPELHSETAVSKKQKQKTPTALMYYFSIEHSSEADRDDGIIPIF